MPFGVTSPRPPSFHLWGCPKRGAWASLENLSGTISGEGGPGWSCASSQRLSLAERVNVFLVLAASQLGMA